jgi:hypothetical protein
MGEEAAGTIVSLPSEPDMYVIYPSHTVSTKLMFFVSKRRIQGLSDAWIQERCTCGNGIVSNASLTDKGTDDRLLKYGHRCFAEYVAMQWIDVFVIPEGVSTRLAAATMTQGLTGQPYIIHAIVDTKMPRFMHFYSPHVG